MKTEFSTANAGAIIVKNNGKFQPSAASALIDVPTKKLTSKHEEALYLSLLRAIKKRNPNQVKKFKDMGANLNRAYFHLPFTGVLDKSYNGKTVHEIVAHELKGAPEHKSLLQIREILAAP